ncbi:hypothetical protein SESBI_37135 [Sesbania bispinosa]|nr:hypothetical protein SESBI_37135 [Sesbania bispinosa]
MPRKFLFDEDEEMQKPQSRIRQLGATRQLLTSWLVSSMTKKITTRIIECEYAHQNQRNRDLLAVVGSPLNSEEQIEAILDGLPEEYDSSH